MASGEKKSQPRPVDVRISGSTFTIRTDASQEYVSRLERYVNEKVEEVQPEGRSLPLKSALALAALSIADDYFSADGKREAVEQEMNQKLRRILLRIDTALEEDAKE